MGFEVGQALEAPDHRVWIDSFDIVATQVSVKEYARFLDATDSSSPHAGVILASLTLSNPWWRSRGTRRSHPASGSPR